MFGRNGVIGVSALLDGPAALNQAIGQVGGAGLAAETSIVRKLLDKSETLRGAFGPYEHATFAHAQQVAACNAVHRTR